MIGAPHPIDTHITSFLYILKVFDILYMWLVVIRMYPTQTQLWSVMVTPVGFAMGIAIVWNDCDPPPSWYSYHVLSIHIKGVWYTLYVVSGHKDVPNTVMVRSGDSTVAVGFAMGIAIVWNDCGPPPSWYSYHILSIHIKGVWYTLYVVSGHMVVAKHSYSMLLGTTMCHSLEHIWDQYDMVEVGDHFRVVCTFILYI